MPLGSRTPKRASGGAGTGVVLTMISRGTASVVDVLEGETGMKDARRHVSLWMMLIALLASCRTDPTVEKRLDALEAKTASVQRATDHLRLLHDTVVQRLDRRNEAVLDPTESGFSTVETGSGVLLVSCSGAEPYLDGYKIKLRVGNPHNMGFSGCEMTVRWGPRAPDAPDETSGTEPSDSEWATWGERYEAWKKKDFRSKKIVLTQDLEPGAWNPVEVILSPSRPEEVGELRVMIRASMVSLKRR